MNLRLDAHTTISLAPTALPGVLLPVGCVFRGMHDLDAAKAYADQVCAWFAANDVPTYVFVVHGPTSTTRLAYEVVEATAGYRVAHRASPPSLEDAVDAAVKAAHTARRPEPTPIEKLVIMDRARTRFEQEGVHFSCLREALSGASGLHRGSYLARCQDFVARQVACVDPRTRGTDGSAQDVVCEFLAHSWEAEYADELEGLFRSYVRGGYIDPRGQVGLTMTEGSSLTRDTALEFAVRRGLTKLLVAMIEEGAAPQEMPALDRVRIEGCTVLGKDGDLLEFIRHHGPNDIHGMLAAATGAIMRAQIRRSTSEQEGALAVPAPPRRQARAM